MNISNEAFNTAGHEIASNSVDNKHKSKGYFVQLAINAAEIRGMRQAAGIVEYRRKCHEQRGLQFLNNECIKCEVKDNAECRDAILTAAEQLNAKD